MKRWCGVLGLLLALGVCATGCGPTGYARAGVIGGGFRDNPEGAEGSGAYLIYFVGQGRTFDFVKYAAYYRAAEVAYNNNYRYFAVLRIEDMSHGIYSPNGGAVPPTVTNIPVIKLHIQCYTQKPPQACYDVVQCLNSMKVPGTQTLYTVDQRHADQLAGTYKTQE